MAGKRMKYDSVSNEERTMLTHLVCSKGVTIKSACEALGINYSTGKTIIQQFKKTGNAMRSKDAYQYGRAKENE